MKITSIRDALSLFAPQRVTERDASRDPSSGGREQDRRGKREEPEAPVSAEELQRALADFAGDEIARTSGLRAEVHAGAAGQSRIRLVDGEGRVLRDVDSREFVRLRLDARVDPLGATTAPKRGKILDQKL